MMSNEYTLEQMIDFEKYPIDKKGSDGYNALLKSVKEALKEKGSVSLKDFLTQRGKDLLQQTVIDKTPEANRTRRYNNVLRHERDS